MRMAGRIGLDFVVAGIKFANRQLGTWETCILLFFLFSRQLT